VGTRELFEQEQSLRLSEAEREALVGDNTRKLYMAATRAGQRLVITYVGDVPEVIRLILLSGGCRLKGKTAQACPWYVSNGMRGPYACLQAAMRAGG
jgi:hypothetical protein